jgi:hypothetical protein
VIVLAWLLAACATYLLAAPMGHNPLAMTGVARAEKRGYHVFWMSMFCAMLADSRRAQRGAWQLTFGEF